MSQSIKQIITMYIAATIGCVIGIMIASGDFETIGGGLIAPLFLLPSVIGYVILDKLKPQEWFKHAVYWVPCTCLLVYGGAVMGGIGLSTLGLGGVLGYLPAVIELSFLKPQSNL